MVFSSVPAYLNPHNWQQQPGGGSGSSELPLPMPPLPPTGVSGGTIRPGSMAERARLAKLPQPEAALRCPRCDSTNTKFCYFNNYNLSQPRHFCKTCRRYWTRGGALRNVPVGGGCRRNKRSKGINGSKSPSTIGSSQASGSTSTVGVIASNNNCTTDMIGQLIPPPPQLPLLSSLPHLSDYGSANIGLNFAGIQTPVAATGGVSGGADMEFQIGGSSSGSGPIFSARFGDQWRLQQLPQFSFLAGLEPPSGIDPFEGDQGTTVNPSSYTGAAADHQLGSKPLDSGVSQPARTVKMEENQGLDLSRNFLGHPRTDQYWGGNAWTDLSGFTSSSTTHLL